jgi:hypothetical protein
VRLKIGGQARLFSDASAMMSGDVGGIVKCIPRERVFSWAFLRACEGQERPSG